MASSGQPFGSRSYTAGKIPDRSMNANAIPFSASSFSRRGLGAAQSEFVPEAAKTSQQAPQQQVHAQTHNPSQESNPLSRLTEEQREEINEAVRRSFPPPDQTSSLGALKMLIFFGSSLASSRFLISTVTGI